MVRFMMSLTKKSTGEFFELTLQSVVKLRAVNYKNYISSINIISRYFFVKKYVNFIVKCLTCMRVFWVPKLLALDFKGIGFILQNKGVPLQYKKEGVNKAFFYSN